ncbi:hypothetical protein [Colwellia piezophila]|uniref:hypothetical protein n=1 Tax=Colwellia piezophila TaxID=211668 RepID=UPI000361D9BB|nr:hypothetical protein [Colwellia piezophila]
MYQDIPINKWPPFEVLWDESLENVRFYGDGYSIESVKTRHPEGLKIADVELSELDKKLFHMNRQRVDEFWDVGLKSKKSDVIKHWMAQEKMTPCKLCIHDNQMEIILGGGNHRLAVARAKALKVIPVLFDPIDEVGLCNIINLNNIRSPV